MAKDKEWTARFGGRLVTGALLFVLLSEWLRPLAAMQEVTGIARVEPLILTLAGLIGIDVLRLPVLPAWLVKAALILSLPAVFHNGSSLFDIRWWLGFVQTLAGDAEVILRFDWQQTSPELRTLLFVLAWAIVAACLFSAVYFKRFMLWFAGATAVYLLTVNWWVGLDTFPALLRVAFAGMVLHVLYVPSVLQRRLGFSRLTFRKSAGWSLAALSLAVLIMGSAAMAAGWFAPRLGQPLADKALAALNGKRWDRLAASLPVMANPGAVSGYGEDDNQLGQPLDMNDDPAFLAVSPHGNRYWRGEAKLVYTGRGWTQPDDRAITRFTLNEWSRAVSVGDPAGGQAEPGREPGREPGDWHLVYWLNDALVHLDRWPLLTTGEPGRIVLFGDRGLIGSADSSPPLVELEAGMGNAHLAGPPPGTAGFLVAGMAGPGDFSAWEHAGAQPLPEGGMSYLQLPDGLPDRVRQLARSLTDPHEETYDKALAIERYLQGNYTYTLKPPVAGEGQDFADHFLFEGHSGYCDHFSTAMTVLLRAAGIPARWVKGFVPGEEMAEEQALQLLAEVGAGSGLAGAGGEMSGEVFYSLVRNSDAHSWVEAYIPGAGWVAFEPTPGFSDDGSAVRLPAEEVAGLADGMEAGDTAKWLQLGRRAWSGLTGRQDSFRPALLALVAAVCLALLLAGWRINRGNKARLPWRMTAGNRFGISLRLLLYRIGFRGAVDGAGLLEDMIVYRLAPYRSGRGDTWREAVKRAVSGEEQQSGDRIESEPAKQASPADPLWRAVQLYERLCYGPGRGDRLSAGELLALWRALGRRPSDG